MAHPDMNDVVLLYQQKLGAITATQRDKLYQAFDEGMSPFVIGCAILRAKEQEKKKKQVRFNYVWAIISDWLVHGIVSESVLRNWMQEQEHYQSVQRGGRSASRQKDRSPSRQKAYTVPDAPVKGSFSFLDD